MAMKPDFRFLRNSFVLLVVALSLAGSAIFFTEKTRQRFVPHQRQQDNLRGRLHKQLQVRSDEKQIMAEKKDVFRTLLSSGKFAREDRMRWIEVAKNHAQRMRLPSLKYNLGARQVYLEEGFPQFPDFAVFATPINLEIGLVHEGDLMTMFSALTDARLGRFSVEQCTLERVGETGNLLATDANIQASCSLSWFSYDQKPPDEAVNLVLVP